MATNNPTPQDDRDYLRYARMNNALQLACGRNAQAGLHIEKFSPAEWAAFAISDRLQGKTAANTRYLRRLAFGQVAMHWIEGTGNFVELGGYLGEGLQHANTQVATAALNGLADTLSTPDAQAPRIRNIVDKYDWAAMRGMATALAAWKACALLPEREKALAVDRALQTMLADYPVPVVPERTVLARRRAPAAQHRFTF